MWRSALINNMICLNYLKPNMKTYIHIYVNPKIISAQLKVNFKLNIITIKSHSHTVLMKKQQNFQIHLESLYTSEKLDDPICAWLKNCLLQKLTLRETIKKRLETIWKCRHTHWNVYANCLNNRVISLLQI